MSDHTPTAEELEAATSRVYRAVYGHIAEPMLTAANTLRDDRIRREALRDAAKAVCLGCEAECPVEPFGCDWFHRDNDGKLVTLCEAAGIHALLATPDAEDKKS